jgi:hypothetical protein
MHMSIATSLRGASLPADYNILPGSLLGYPFLTDATATTLMLFGMPLYTLLLLLLRSPRSPFRSSTALHAIYGGLTAINAFWFLHSLGDGTLFTRHGLFGTTSARAAWDNPLLPAPTSCPPYHSWIFEPRKVLKR